MSNTKSIYDVCSCPHGMNLDKIVQIWKEHEFVIYDSIMGEKPILFDTEDESKALLVDVSNTNKEKLEQIHKLITE